jgi:hypothetical protein
MLCEPGLLVVVFSGGLRMSMMCDFAWEGGKFEDAVVDDRKRIPSRQM